jgi:hypothetical protein
MVTHTQVLAAIDKARRRPGREPRLAHATNAHCDDLLAIVALCDEMLRDDGMEIVIDRLTGWGVL